jgi:hypothetical protein
MAPPFPTVRRPTWVDVTGLVIYFSVAYGIAQEAALRIGEPRRVRR